MRPLIAAAGIAGGVSVALAQGPGGWVIEVNYGPGQSSVSPGNPTCRVRISATHHPGDYAVARVGFDALCAEAGWASPSPWDNLAPMNMGSNPGSNVGPNRAGIIGNQLNFTGIFADPRSPIGVWEVAWTAASFTPRAVAVSTRTARFDVYPSRVTPSGVSRMSGLVEAQGSIVVTPSPGVLAACGMGAAFIARRRRERGGG